MPSFKKLGAIAAAVLTLSAIGAANASAASFTASATGSLTGSAKSTHVITTNGGTIECSNVATSGAITATTDTQWHVTHYLSACKAFTFATVDIASFTFQNTGWKDLHIKASLVFTPTLFGSSLCTATIPSGQTVDTVDFANSGANNVLMTYTITGIKYTSSGGPCGTAGTFENGTYSGINEFSRVGGGTLRYDP